MRDPASWQRGAIYQIYPRSFADGDGDRVGEASDPRSTLTLFRRLAALRAATPALQTGTQRMLDTSNGVLAWQRADADDQLLTAVNFDAADATLPLPADATLLLSTDPDRTEGAVQPAGTLQLGPEEAVVLRLASVSPAASPRPSS
jgi:alpha-glucosidase